MTAESTSDCWYVIRVHPLGGYAAVLGFSTDGEDGRAYVYHQSWPSIEAAAAWVRSLNEYRLFVHPECNSGNGGPR
jgi:hypothetical protein